MSSILKFSVYSRRLIIIRTIKIGTRGSKLALIQTEMVIQELKKQYPNWRFEINPIKTWGDRLLDKDLNIFGGKGLFLEDIENKLLSNNIDLAVHSAKDVPVEIPDELGLIAMLKREDVRDVFVSSRNIPFFRMRKNARIGTSSLRRSVQLKFIQPELEIVPLRGNITTRIKKIEELDLDGIILAAAGLKRLGWEKLITNYFDQNLIVPAIGQGTIVIESRIDSDLNLQIRKINHDKTELAVKVERSFMKALDGNCHMAIGAYASIIGKKIHMIGMTESDGRIRKEFIIDEISKSDEIGKRLAQKLGENR